MALVGRLEAAQQLVQRVQHLLGELRRDLVLVPAAVGEQARQALLAREREQPRSSSSRCSAARIGRPAICSMSATRNSSQPELSPRGA